MLIRWLEDKGHDWLKVLTWRPRQAPAVVFPVGPLAGYVIANAEDDKRVCRRFAIAAIASSIFSSVVPVYLIGFRAGLSLEIVFCAVGLITSLITIGSVVISLARLPLETSVAAYFEWQDVQKTQGRRNNSAILAAACLFLLGVAPNLPRPLVDGGLVCAALCAINSGQLTIALRLRDTEYDVASSNSDAELRM